MDIIVDRLLREFKVEANVGAPQVAYKETITKAVDVDSKYAKQSGGRGQYGHCKVKFEPMDANGEELYKFESTVVGGAIPKEYIPAVGEGIEEAMKAGILGGFPVVGVYANVYDGSYHEVDSSEMAFHIAGSLAFKDAMQKAAPVLLEPIMKVEVTTPEDYMGDVIGDINSRRHCKVKFEPMDANGEELYKFESTVVGGAIPKEYIPAVGEGIEEAMKAGILGGFPVVGVYANVYDGSYHEVDSSEMAFHIAGSLAFKDAMQKAAPVLLEPIMKVEVTTPEDYMGDVIGDINSRRGRIEGMEDIGGGKMIRGYVPLSEMFGYATDLRSRTQGRGNYSMFFEKYEQVPKSVQEKILAKKD